MVRVQLIFRVGQNRIFTPYMTVYLVISLPKIPYIHRIYMVLANPTHTVRMSAWFFDFENRASSGIIAHSHMRITICFPTLRIEHLLQQHELHGTVP